MVLNDSNEWNVLLSLIASTHDNDNNIMMKLRKYLKSLNTSLWAKIGFELIDDIKVSILHMYCLLQ